MRRLCAIAAIVVVTFAIQTTAKEHPMFVIEKYRIRAVVPGWVCRNGILNRPPSAAQSDRPVLVSLCEHEIAIGNRETIDVKIFQVDSRADAALSLAPQRERQVAAGWSVKTMNVGDEAYLSTYRDGEGFQIKFRCGLNVVEVSGKSLALVKRVAREVKSQLPIALLPQRNDMSRFHARYRRVVRRWGR